jgi:hypothetical protein
VRWREIRFFILVCAVSGYVLGIHAQLLRIQEA